MAIDYTLKWFELLESEKRISRSLIEPHKLYRISVYKKGEPNTQKRYVFVIGLNRQEKKIDCLKLNNINPIHFIKFLNRIRNKKVEIRPDLPINEMLMNFPINGKQLFEKHIKPNKLIYSKDIDSYRVYKLDKITYISEVSFEDDVFMGLFSDSKTVSDQRNVIKEEIAEDND